jgi:hypothetical protein
VGIDAAVRAIRKVGKEIDFVADKSIKLGRATRRNPFIFQSASQISSIKKPDLRRIVYQLLEKANFETKPAVYSQKYLGGGPFPKRVDAGTNLLFEVISILSRPGPMTRPEARIIYAFREFITLGTGFK